MDNVITKEIWIDAPVERVFKHFTETDAMLTWHGKEVELNATPGGTYRVVFESGDVITGEFKEVVPNERIVYAANYWGVHTIVEVRFTAANGGTTVNLSQEFHAGRDISSFEHGWEYFLGILQEILGTA